MADTKFIAKSFTQDGLTVKIQLGDHEIITDQPKEGGGNDQGPCPAYLLSAAICGCTSIMTNQLIQKMKLDVKDFHVEVTCSLADDFAKDQVGMHDISLTYSFDSDEPKEKLEKLVQNVETYCPVMNTIKKPPQFHTEIKVG